MENDLENNLDNKTLDEAFIYRLNIRGFTKSNSSKVVDKGTFKGILEKVDYLKEIGADFIFADKNKTIINNLILINIFAPKI